MVYTHLQVSICVFAQSHLPASAFACHGIIPYHQYGMENGTGRQICCGDLQGQIKKLEPLLAALAAVPWIDPDAEDGQRVPFIKTTVLDEVEGMGRLCQSISTCTASADECHLHCQCRRCLSLQSKAYTALEG